MSSGYTKLYSTILDSSIWSADLETRIVWVTMLAMASKNGVVHGSVGGIARRANVHPEACERALAVLEGPDADDKSGVLAGRRIIRMQGSWEIVNFGFYRETKSIDAVRKAQYRERCPGQSRKRSPAPAPETSPAPETASILSSPAPPAPDGLPVVRDVFDEWRRVHNHPGSKLDAKRTARIRAGLKLHTPEQLKQAIRGALKSDWLMGRDPKSPRKYDGLETILRDTAQIERLIELETGKATSNGYRPQTAGASRQTDDGVDPWSFHKGDRQ